MKKLHNWFLLFFFSSFTSFFILPWVFTIGVFIAGLTLFCFHLIQIYIEESVYSHED